MPLYHPPGPGVPAVPGGEIGERETLAGGGGLRGQLRGGGWRAPLLVFVLALGIYALTSFDRLKGPSADTHFVYLANTYNAMIAGNFDPEVKAQRASLVPFEMGKAPPHQNDWASYWEVQTHDGERFRGIWLEHQGWGAFRTLSGQQVVLAPGQLDTTRSVQRHFVSFPPAPAVLMMPLAYVWGYGVNDVWFTLCFAALNVTLLYLLLERLSSGGRTGRGRRENLWLVGLFAFGSAHYWCSVLGQVWFTALVVGVTWTLAYVWCAIDAKRPLWAGIFCALAFATRTPLLFGSVFFFLCVLFPGGRVLTRGQWGEAAKRLALFCAPCLAVGVGLMAMNQVRFESFTEFGHTYLAAGGLQRIQKFGLFDPHFLSMNLSALLTLLPEIKAQSPYLGLSKHGMSIFLTTPALLWVFWPKVRENRCDRFWWRALWVTVAACALPGLFYQNTGYAQFGYRFSMDYMVYLVLLLGVGRAPFGWAFKAAVLWGVGVNTFGALSFGRWHQFYSDRFFP